MKRYLFIFLAAALLIAGCGDKSGAEDAAEPVVDPARDTGFRTELEPDYAAGTVTGGVYESAYFGLGFAPPESWSFLSAEELDTLSVTHDAAFDLYAQADNGLLSVNITVEPADVALEPEDHVDRALSLLPETLAQLGYENVSAEKIVESFAGKGRFGLYLAADAPLGGETKRLYERQYRVKREGFLALVTISSFSRDRTSEIAGYFYAVA